MTARAGLPALWLPRLAALDWRRDNASLRSTDQPMFDLRLYLVPDREALERRGDALYRSLAAMQLWLLGEAPVRVPRKGTPAILREGAWQPLPVAELVARGRPCSFQSFATLWPDLVSVDEYLSESDSAIPAIGRLQERAVASAAELLQQEVEERRLTQEGALGLLQDFAQGVQGVPAEIVAERQALESGGYEPTPEWQGRLASSRLATLLARLSVQLQLAAAGTEVPLHLLNGSEILQLALGEDIGLLAADGEHLTTILTEGKKAQFDGRLRLLLCELAASAAAEHLGRCGDELAAIHTFASCRDRYWKRAEEELALLDRSCRREACKDRIVSFLARNAARLARLSLAAGRVAAEVPRALLRRLAEVPRHRPTWFRLGQREA